MAPKFNLKQLRRRSLASFRTSSRSTDTSSNDEPSSSSQELSSVGSITPPSLADESRSRPPYPDFSLDETAPRVEQQPDQLQQNQSLSQYAPQVTNIRDKTTVYQKVLLVTGIVGQDAHPQVDGTILVSRPDKAFPSTIWPVYGGRFKALVYLLPGPNSVSFEFQKAGSPSRHRSIVLLYMFDPKNAPPLQLAILVAKDSPYTFDQLPTDSKGEDTSLDKAVRKFRTAAYLWQSFTAEQMDKNDLGRRTFRFDEEWTNGTSHPRDFSESTMRSEARVHIVQTNKTVAEIRELESAQQNGNVPNKSSPLVDMTAAALRDYFRIAPGQKQYVAAIILDTHRDVKDKVIKGYTSFGGPVGHDLHLAMFGSDFLGYYPSTISEAVQAFRDCSPMEPKLSIDEANVAGTSWEAASYGIGAHLREVGRLLGSPQQEKGIMAGDFLTMNRAFLVREAYSTRTKSKGAPVEPKDEPFWHRLDVLRYRFHSLFRNTTDKIPYPEGTVHGWVVEKDRLLVTANSGLLCTEIFAEGDPFCSTWIEYPRDGQMVRRTTLIESELRERLPESKRRSKMAIIVRSMGGGALVIDDLHELCANSSLKLNSGPLASGPLSKLAYRSTKIGGSDLDGSEPQEVVFSNALASINRIMSSVTVYHGDAVDGIEFHYDDNSSQLFGKRGGKSYDRFAMDIRNAEVIVGFAIRSGSWIDAIQIITSTTRRSNIYGNLNGGSLHTLLVPSGFKICGVSGSCADWLNSFSLLITR
ncbi:hypothetical protein NPX13_g6643 [Xylaria arbuscula]|uniref:Jacalin-type lectin domain-containing protein n=1 Tax=Xylaria arbuscula TaxID=114810 RepID=A0A9W8NC78_9PEZI|nr:hypothetical protein NPX13_g6643 [Xylaria arbuscula]